MGGWAVNPIVTGGGIDGPFANGPHCARRQAPGAIGRQRPVMWLGAEMGGDLHQQAGGNSRKPRIAEIPGNPEARKSPETQKRGNPPEARKPGSPEARKPGSP